MVLNTVFDAYKSISSLGRILLILCTCNRKSCLRLLLGTYWCPWLETSPSMQIDTLSQTVYIVHVLQTVDRCIVIPDHRYIVSQIMQMYIFIIWIHPDPVDVCRSFILQLAVTMYAQYGIFSSESSFHIIWSTRHLVYCICIWK